MAANPLPRPEPQRRGGFTPLPNECLWDWSRLVSGDAQVLSILFINSEIHTLRKKGSPVPKWTGRAITNEELAQFARCTVRAIEIGVGDLVARKVIERKKTARGYVYSIPFASWAALPDRPSKVVTLGEAEDAEEESEDEAKKQPKGQVFAVFAKPQKVRPGTRTRPKELPAAAGRLQFEAETEIEFDARMCDGILTIRAKGESGTGTKGEEKRNRLRVDSTQVPSNQQPSNFHLFENVWLRHGINAAPKDWAAARVIWSKLGINAQLAAVKGVTDRFDQGEYEDPRFIPLPQNYLRDELWMRSVRPKKKPGKVKVYKDEATTLAAHDMARAMDRELAKRRGQ